MNLAHRLQHLQTLTQRKYTTAQRKTLAAKGQAMKDGNFPIVDRTDLKNAVHDIGRAGDEAAAKTWITKRAKALKATDVLPADWPGSTKGKAVKQDDAGGVLSPQTCPKCGATIKAGVLSPETGGKKKRKKSVQQNAVIIQVDPVKKAMTAVVQAPDVPHLVQLPGADGTPQLVSIVYDAACIQQAAWDFLTDGLQRAIGVDHTEVTEAGIVPPNGEIAIAVESFIAPVCYEANGRHIIQGSWVQTYQFTDDDVWESVLRGERKAPSLTAPLSQVELEPIT